MKINLYLLVFCFGISLAACSAADKNADIKTLYKQGEYEKIIDQKTRIKDSVDTALFIVACSKLERFDEVEPFVQHLKGYRNYFGLVFSDTTGMTREQKKKLNFPDEKYSSLEMFYMGHYFFHRLKIDRTNEYERFIRVSLQKDTTNIYALYDYAKEFLSTKEYSLASLILKRLLQIDPNWTRAMQMRDYCEEKRKEHKYPFEVYSINKLLEHKIAYPQYDPEYEKY